MDMRSAKYPYRLDVERRLPNGSLTTDGYAARHPVEFRHWGHARGYFFSFLLLDFPLEPAL